MMMLIHKICIALSGFGRLSTVDRVIRLKAEMLLQRTKKDIILHGFTQKVLSLELKETGTYVLNWNRTKFFML